MSVLIAFLLTGILALFPLFSFSATEPLCVECLNIRIGRPLVVRGPAPDESDAAFVGVRLSDGRVRGFTANGDTFSLVGHDPWSMGGERTLVLPRGNPNSYAECGRWLNGLVRHPRGVIFGFVHTERYCGSQARWAMAMAISRDEGRSWRMLGRFMTGTDTAVPGKVSGEGACSVVDGADGFYYAYCLRLRDWKHIVARAPVSRPSPKRWRKWFDGSWSQPACGGDATALAGEPGMAAARWTDTNSIVLFGIDPWFGGIKLSLSQDKVNFTTLSEPILLLEGDPWARPAPTELFAYLAATNYYDVSNQIGSQFLLSHVWIPPGEGFDKRYLVFRDVWMWRSQAPAAPQVGVALSQWSNGQVSVSPVVGAQHLGVAGYLMTRPPALPSVKIEECADHTLQLTCAVKVRTAGWAYRDPQPDTSPLWSRGEMLGYVLNN